MPKFYEKIGFIQTIETSPGIWTENLIERPYYIDLTRNGMRTENHNQVNDDIKINNSFSFVADPYAYQNFCFIKYVTCMGTKWKVESVDASNPPRLTLQASTRYVGPDDIDE